MAMKTVAEALGETSGPLARKVLQYSNVFKSVVDKAKRPDFGASDWAPLAELVAVDEFERVGVAKEVMDWPTYTGFLTGFAGAMEWNGFFRRITETPNVVFLELEEHCTSPERGTDIANTMTVYEFNAAGKLRRLDVYLQSAALSAG